MDDPRARDFNQTPQFDFRVIFQFVGATAGLLMVFVGFGFTLTLALQILDVIKEPTVVGEILDRW